MRKREILLGTAVTATLLALQSTFAGVERVPGDAAAIRQARAGQSGLSAGGLTNDGLMSAPEGSATWVGPSDNPRGQPPTDPTAGLWFTPSNWSGNTVPNGPTDVATFNANTNPIL